MLQITSFLNVLMTKNLSAQVDFYKNLGLELIFDNKNTLGLGKSGKLFWYFGKINLVTAIIYLNKKVQY